MIKIVSGLIAELTERWSEIDAGFARPKHLNYLQIAGTSRVNRKSIFLIWADNQSEPTYVLKLLRDCNDSDDLANEYEALIQLSAIENFADACPRPVFYGQLGKNIALLQTFCKGHSLGAHLSGNERNALGYVHSPVNWLTQFHCQTSRTSTASNKDIEEFMIEPIEEFVTYSDIPSSLNDFLRQISEESRVLIGRKWLKCFRHGDFWAGNILIESQRIRVIDWEFANPEWWPLYDLLHYCVQLVAVIDRVSIVEAFDRAFNARQPRSALTSKFVRSYCETLGIPLSDVELYFWAYIVTLANRERMMAKRDMQRGFLNLNGDPRYHDKPLTEFLRRDIYLDAIRALEKKTTEMFWSSWQMESKN